MATTPTSAVKVNAETNALVIPSVANFCSANGIAQLSDLTSFFDYKGGQDCSGNPNYPAALKGDVYSVTVAGKIGGASGVVVAVGDTFLATADNAGGTQAAVGTSWIVSQANIDLANIDITGGTISGVEIDALASAFDSVYSRDFVKSVSGATSVSLFPTLVEFVNNSQNASLVPPASLSGAWTWTLPNKSGTLLVGGDIGVSVQAYDADLTTWAGITPAAGVGTALAIAPNSAGGFSTLRKYSGSASLTSFAAIGGELTPISITVTGAVAGDKATVNLPPSVDGLPSVGPVEVTTDTVTVYIYSGPDGSSYFADSTWSSGKTITAEIIK